MNYEWRNTMNEKMELTKVTLSENNHIVILYHNEEDYGLNDFLNFLNKKLIKQPYLNIKHKISKINVSKEKYKFLLTPKKKVISVINDCSYLAGIEEVHPQCERWIP